MVSVESEKPLAFLCHSWADKEAVRQLYGKLTDDGYRCWFDEIDLVPGQDWEREINHVLRRCDYVIVCLSQTSVTRRGFAQREIQAALDIAGELPEGEIFLIPVCLEPCQPPDRLRRLHWVDLFSENGYQQLTRAIQPRGISNATVPASAWDRIVPPMPEAQKTTQWKNYRAATTSVFISYRRRDVPFAAGRLYDDLVQELGTANVFMDVDSLELGIDLHEVVLRAVAESDAVIVLIGNAWLGHNRDSTRDIDSPGDIVRIQLETALGLGTSIIPVLVDGADILAAEPLPKSIAKLLLYNTLRLSHESYRSDVSEIIRLLRLLH